MAHKPTSSPSIYPSLMGANLLELGSIIKELDPYCPGYHLDVIDGHFADNISGGPAWINAIARVSEGVHWVHLMVTDPLHWLDRLELSERSIISIHYESFGEEQGHSLKAVIGAIKQRKWLASLAIKPKTNIAILPPLLSLLDQVLVMSVEPGFSGQDFIPDSLEKIQQIVRWRIENNLTLRIGIDGGISENNIAEVIAAGAQDLAIAGGIFGVRDLSPAEQLLKLRKYR